MRRAPAIPLAHIPSDRTPGKFYIVSLNARDRVVCNCRSYQFTRRCKHIHAFRNTIASAAVRR